MAWDFEVYHGLKRHLDDIGYPRDLAEKAARVVASDSDDKERTPEEQRYVTLVARYCHGLPPEDGLVLGGTNARQTTND